MAFKSLEELHVPDPRFANCSAGDPTNLFRPIALEYP
jgi:hypothetical protein